jgi:hypothetical protein
MGAKKRIQVDLSGEVLDELESIRVASGSTMASIFRNALKLYKFAREEEAKKSKILVEGKNGDKRQIIIP